MGFIADLGTKFALKIGAALSCTAIVFVIRKFLLRRMRALASFANVIDTNAMMARLARPFKGLTVFSALPPPRLFQNWLIALMARTHPLIVA